MYICIYTHTCVYIYMCTDIEFHLISPFFSCRCFCPGTAPSRGRTTWGNPRDQSDAPRVVSPVKIDDFPLVNW